MEKLIHALDSEEKRIQSGSAELLALLSEDYPDLVAPYMSKFIENLDVKEPVLRWEAVCTLGNLARVDEEKKILEVLPTMYPLLRHKSIVLANHTVQALSKIAEYHQEKAGEILDQLVNASPSFKKTTVGFIIEALARFKGYDGLVPRVKEFITPYLESETRIVAQKAKRTLKKLG